jgi:hypothetical protein
MAGWPVLLKIVSKYDRSKRRKPGRPPRRPRKDRHSPGCLDIIDGVPSSI